ncbi:hypothetical protein AVEN_92468-1 [Araneus ventricosus]|uniref:Uncharacterized protein n=1 Tax=Araneus ventricosus TaxID=182803 RepID=A0A4Y2AJ23_ARAVE|nr:hypothetical protein AVEN_92468-1 [Araneus ventricosus]
MLVGQSSQRPPLVQNWLVTSRCLNTRRKNVINTIFVPPVKVLLPPLHIKLGLMKQFIKSLSKNGECFRYMCSKFPKLSEAKLKEGVFAGPTYENCYPIPSFPVAVFRTGVRGGRLLLRESKGPQNLCNIHRSAKPVSNLRYCIHIFCELIQFTEKILPLLFKKNKGVKTVECKKVEPGPGTKHWEEISLGDLLPSQFDHPHLPMFLQNVETDLETLEQPSDYWNGTPPLCKLQGLV